MNIGLKNNNWLNVKNAPGNPWRDAAGVSGTDDKGHAIFSDPAWGLRAGILNLQKYYLSRGLKTVAQILATWAPSSDTVGSILGAPANSPREYTEFVCKRMGVGPNLDLQLFNDNKTLGNVANLTRLVKAMAAFEIGGGFDVPDKDLLEALGLISQGRIAA